MCVKVWGALKWRERDRRGPNITNPVTPSRGQITAQHPAQTFRGTQTEPRAEEGQSWPGTRRPKRAECKRARTRAPALLGPVVLSQQPNNVPDTFKILITSLFWFIQILTQRAQKELIPSFYLHISKYNLLKIGSTLGIRVIFFFFKMGAICTWLGTKDYSLGHTDPTTQKSSIKLWYWRLKVLFQ